MIKSLIFILVIAYSLPSFSLDLSCTIDNYKDFIYDKQKTAELIDQTDKGCYLRDANLLRADLRRAHLSQANLVRADLRGADLVESNLRSADLRWAKLRGSNLSYANLEEADLRGAKLIDVNLSWTNLSKADLRGADLGGFLGGSYLHNTNVKGAYYNDATDLPGPDWLFNPREKGMIYKD